MNLKQKVILLLLALSLLLAIRPIHIDAATDSNTVTIKKTYNLEGTGTSPQETFKLIQTGKSLQAGESDITVPDLVGIKEDDNLVVASTTAIEGAAGNVDSSVNPFTITLPTYTRVGVYKYTLQEINNNTAGVTYYDKTITLLVQVFNDEKNEGAFIIKPVVYDDYENNSKLDANEGIVNTYEAGNLKVTKTVKGNMADVNKSFKFTITLTGEEGKTYADSYALGSDKDTIKVGESKDVYLKHNEAIEINGLPAGVTYTVTESDYADYTPDDKEITGTITKDGATAAFVNTKTKTPETGLSLDNLPYLFLLAGVILAIALLLVRKRK